MAMIVDDLQTSPMVVDDLQMVNNALVSLGYETLPAFDSPSSGTHMSTPQKTKNTTNISGIALLKDLIDKGLAAVQEIDDSGRVDTVRVINNSNQDLLLLSGDILEGAKQNRMIMEHVIIKKK